MYNFAMIGAAGFIAPRHMKAIADTGNRLVAAIDKNDSVGIIDSYFPEAKFFTEIERFDRELEKRKRRSEDERVQYISICTPNYLHDAHIRLALRVGADAICEKPLVVNPWNLDALERLEEETGKNVYTVLQLREHPVIRGLKARVQEMSSSKRMNINLTYVTRRGPWYQTSWKGDENKSGGVVMNIGIHFFDMLMWVFGKPSQSEVFMRTPHKVAGRMELENASVNWFLSVDETDIPAELYSQGKRVFRSITIDGQDFEFSDGFNDLHTRVYEGVLAGRGYRISEARSGIETVYQLRKQQIVEPRGLIHPFLQQRENNR